MGLLAQFEDALEGSLLRYGLGDLADLYRDRMTIRQLWVRVKALPWESPLWIAWRNEQEQSEERGKLEDVESALAMFGRSEGT